MPPTISALLRRPDSGADTTPATQPDTAWYDAAWTAITGGTATSIAVPLLAATLGALAAYLWTRKPSAKGDFSKHLMYAPLLLVNAAAIYGQVAFFYDSVAPSTWPTIGKLALALVIAGAVESIAVYVGWHAHDALLHKAGTTAARLRRWSYLIAGLVGAINYAHFANWDKNLGLNAASAAFGLLSLLSPWLWGLHTRRMQHVQLTKEGAVDATGATFSAERIRSFPIRSAAARRWSIDHYVTDPQQAWEGYNAELRARWADTVNSPTWWMRTNPIARVKQLDAAVRAGRSAIAMLLLHGAERDAGAERAVAEHAKTVTELTDRITALTAERDSTAGALHDTRTALDTLRAEHAALAEQHHSLTTEHIRMVEQARDTARTASTEQTLAAHRYDTERTARIAAEQESERLRSENAEQAQQFTRVLTDMNAERTEHAQQLEALRNAVEQTGGNVVPIRAPRRSTGGKVTVSRSAPSDTDDLAKLFAEHPERDHKWTDRRVNDITGAGFSSRAPRLARLATQHQQGCSAPDHGSCFAGRSGEDADDKERFA
ncbi:MAG TPA: hypothetical protein VI172_14075 [Candidatus Dormibacteraeota bacterium]|jgi:hypothetical protein